MGRGFSLEFGRKGPEGLKAEYDENLIDDTIQGDGSEIKKLLDDIDTSMDEEDYSDCEKKVGEKEKLDFSDCLKQSVKEDEEIDEYYEDCEKEQEKLLEEAEKESDRLKSEIDEIFG